MTDQATDIAARIAQAGERAKAEADARRDKEAKAQLPADARIETAALTEEAERRLHGALIEVQRGVSAAAAERRYGASLTGLIALAKPVADFFERIMVMDENVERRTNRLALLRDAQRLLAGPAVQGA